MIGESGTTPRIKERFSGNPDKPTAVSARWRRCYAYGMRRPALDIGALTPGEQLDLLERLWDSLAPRPEVAPLIEDQRAELDRRLDDLERDGPVDIPWDAVLSRIRSLSP